jgi:hypothetical protein
VFPVGLGIMPAAIAQKIAVAFQIPGRDSEMMK